MTKGEKNIKSDYKPSQFGLIPSSWAVKNVESLTIDHKQGFYTKEEYSKNGKYLLIRGMDLNSPRVNWQNSPKVNATDEEFDLYKVEIGDFLFVRSGNIGTYGIVESEIPPSIFASYLIRFKLDQKAVLNYFFGAFYTSNLCYNQLKKITQGSSNININANNIKCLNIPLPSLHEQKKITNLLTTWDDSISKLETLIAQKELRQKWLMQNLLTGKKRLKGFSEDWKNFRLGDVTTNFSRRNKDLIEAKVYSVTNTNGFVLQSEYFEGKVSGEDLSNYKIIKKHEFAYNPARINVGSIAYFEREIGVISSLYVCFITKREILDYYLHKFLFLDHTKYRIETLGEGGVRIYLWYDLFSKIKIKLPPLEEQTAIVEVLQAADKEIQLLKTKTEKLREQKKGLLQVLLTGKKRLVIN